MHYTRSTHKASVTEQHKSAITDRVAATNHSINWEEAKVIDREADKCTRWIKEAIWIHRRGQQTLNKDAGAYKLHNIFDQLILTTSSTGTSRKYKWAVGRTPLIRAPIGFYAKVRRFKARFEGEAAVF